MSKNGKIHWKLLITIVAVYFASLVKSKYCPSNSKLEKSSSLDEQQSPININLETVIGQLAGKLNFSTEYYRQKTFRLYNCDGKSFRLETQEANELTISNGPMKVTYTFKRMQFHIPSEHTVDNKYYPMELHVIHEQTSDKEKDQFVILGYGFQICKKDNAGMKKIIDALPKVSKEGNSTEIKNFTLTNFLGPAPSAYFTYEGSETTAPYTESVKWIINTHLIRISPKQMDVFHKVAKKNPKMVNSNRAIQKLSGRQVYLLISLKKILSTIESPNVKEEIPCPSKKIKN